VAEVEFNEDEFDYDLSNGSRITCEARPAKPAGAALATQGT